MASYETEIKVRFGDIDHAGIAYYPRISHYCHVALEEFYQDVVGIPYHRLLDERRLGFPTVHAELDFRETLAFGDVARVEMNVLRIGNSSLRMRYRIRKRPGGDVSVEAEITTVCIAMETFKPVRIPDDLREVFEACRED